MSLSLILFFENITKENITERSELSNVFNSILQEIAFKEIVKTIETISDEKDPKRFYWENFCAHKRGYSATNQYICI